MLSLSTFMTIMAGGPGSGCRGDDCGRKVTVYHGTSARLARAIRKNGLKPIGSKGVKRVDFYTVPGRVHVTRNREMAERYALKNKKPAVVKMELPEELAAKMRWDQSQPGSVYLRGRIPAKFVTKVHEFKGYYWTNSQ